MKLVEFFGQLMELKIEEVPQPDQGDYLVKTWIDPTPQQIIALVKQGHSFRGIYNGKNLFIWQADDQGHARMVDALKQNQFLPRGYPKGLIYLFFSQDRDEMSFWNAEVGNVDPAEVPILVDGIMIGSYGVEAQFLNDPLYPYFKRWLGSDDHWQLVEARVYTTEIGKMWLNPTLSEIKLLVNSLELRGLLTSKDLYVWDAYDAVHHEGENALRGMGIKDKLLADVGLFNPEDDALGWGVSDYMISDGARVEVRFYRVNNSLSQIELLQNHRIIKSWGLPVIKSVSQGSLAEAQVIDVDSKWQGRAYKVYQNPTFSELSKLVMGMDLRGVAYRDSVYLVDARNMTHYQLKRELFSSDGYDGLESDDEDTTPDDMQSIYINHVGSQEISGEWNYPGTIKFKRDNVELRSLNYKNPVTNNRVIRSWMKKPVAEAQVIQTDDLVIYKNPTFSEISQLVKTQDLRGVCDAKDVYVCNAYGITHHGIYNALQDQHIELRAGNANGNLFIHDINSREGNSGGEWGEFRKIGLQRGNVVVKTDGLVISQPMPEDKDAYKVVPITNNRIIKSWNK
jgi:hypothetical protein